MISLLVINYRSAALACGAIRSARAAAKGSMQVVAVENTCDAAEADALRSAADVVITPPRNLGYAAGMNAGRAACNGETIVISNPDVIFAQGSIDALAAALKDAAVAGPAFFWDDAHTWMLPPSELHTATEKIGEALASRNAAYARQRDRRRIAERIRFWSLTSPSEVPAISGAVMAIRASDFDAVRGFDERFALYFEENDFLRRIAQQRKRILYVPAARCRHLYNQSAGSDIAAATLAYAESEMRYLAKWYGRKRAAFLKRLERPRVTPLPPRIDGPIALPHRRVVVEASPLASFETAAGCFPSDATIDVPDEVWRSYRSDVLYLRVVDRDRRRVLATYARYRS